MGIKVAVVGSRIFQDYTLLCLTLDEIHFYQTPIDLIVSGGAKGADSLAEKWAGLHGIKTLIFKPDWKQYGKAAGMIRNKDIIKEADMVIAFWDGQSRGTQNSISLAKSSGKALKIIEF